MIANHEILISDSNLVLLYEQKKYKLSSLSHDTHSDLCIRH